MEEVARVVLGFDSPELTEQIMHFLDRSGRARVVGTAGDESQLGEAVRQLEPHAIIASPGMLRGAERDCGAEILAVDTAESVELLRESLRARARGFFLWPGERDELANAAASAIPPAAHGDERRADVLAVLGPRGGAGATFVATHLAAAFAHMGKDCVLVDLDAGFADVSAALGANSDDDARSVADLSSVLGEITREHLDEVLWRHSSGFSVLLAPPDPEDGITEEACRAIVGALVPSSELIVLHLSRTLDERCRLAFELADKVLLVMAMDRFSFNGARRILDAFSPDGKCEFIANRVLRSEVTPADIEQAFGRPALASIPFDRGVPGAQDRGRLASERGRAGRAIAVLARTLAGSR